MKSQVSKYISIESKLGRWSFYSLIFFFVFLGIFALLVWSGQRGGETFFSNTLLTIPFVSAAVSAISAFVTGILSVIRQRERSIFVFISIIVGFLVLMFLSAELLFPH